MLQGTDIWIGIAGTVVLWLLSAALAVAAGLALAAGSASEREWIRLTARAAVNVTRGVPTSLFVIAAGLGMMRLAAAPPLPTVFPGTGPFQHLAWGVVIALALGSAGHFAEIFYAARTALGRVRLDAAKLLGLPLWRRTALIARECASIALPPTGARLVHHLHNTAFAALFPIADLFGAVQGQASITFEIFRYTLLGCGVYVALSVLIWLATRFAESALAPPAPESTQQHLVIA